MWKSLWLRNQASLVDFELNTLRQLNMALEINLWTYVGTICFIYFKG